MALSTFLTVWTLRYFFGSIDGLLNSTFSSSFIIAITVMALVQYVSNSSLAAVRNALKTDQPLWETWKKNYLWTSVTFFASASAAGIIAKLAVSIGTPAIILTIPIVAVIYMTLRTYRENIETTAEKVTQAENHVRELSSYIEEQARIREQFTQIEKLSALGELASGVAHNFNNTLAGILARAQMILNINGLPEDATKGLQVIVRTAEDGAKTVKRIQDFARQRRDQMFEPIAVDHLLWEVGEITRPRWKDRAEAENIHISLSLKIDSEAWVMGDAGELREVLVNMVFNAVDAMPAGGRLTLAARESDGLVEISITDTGGGMSECVRSRVFDPFFTTKGKGGMGLGLAVSYGTIRRHEGTISVNSIEGQGTTFYIRLPAAGHVKPSQEKLAPRKPTGVAALPRKVRILVVEDEDYLRDLLRDIIEGAGCEVALAANGVEALDLFGAQTFDAVYTDVGLPGMNGWELARNLRVQNEKILIAIITGWGDAVSAGEREEAQVNWVVTKPFSLERILTLSQEVVELSGQDALPHEMAEPEQGSLNSRMIN
jgi:signal transduction histidine kinase/ActR/RegA family two-component response regulator